MRQFLLGYLTAALSALVLYGAVWHPILNDPCRHCGNGTMCDGGRCVVPSRQVAEPVRKRAVSRALTAQDLRLAVAGDRPRWSEVDSSCRVDSGSGESKPQQREALLSAHRPALQACVDKARGEEVVTGSAHVLFHLHRGGSVGEVQVEAPAILLKRDLLSCVRAALGAATFPETQRPEVIRVTLALAPPVAEPEP